MIRKIIVIGGGPAGMMAAGKAAENGASVTLIEKNAILGKKLLLTGKGRCNVTNYCDTDNVIKNVNSCNPKFLYSAISEFGCFDTYAFFEKSGVPLKVERGNRVFPVSDRAVDIRNALKKYISVNGVKILNETVISVTTSPFCITTNLGKHYADAVIIATGGLSYPSTGSTGDGYRFARLLSHNVIDTSPALVALIGSEKTCSKLAGLSLKNVSVNFSDSDGKILYSDFGEMLFTHTGVSGPVILSASSVLDFARGGCTLSIDLKPALSYEELDSRILRDFDKYINKDFSNSLSDLLPSKIIPVIVSKSGINPHEKVNNITRTQRRVLCESIKSFKIFLRGKAGYDEAVITSGGVNTSEINPKTMESLCVKGLYFAGEVIDLDANTGGYNLQIAFSTGFLAGKCCTEE